MLTSFVDGDDTPWSKDFLASAYASRGVKVRFTSGTGSEALMGHAEQHSMLYLEALPAGSAWGRQPGRPEWLDLVHCLAGIPAGRCARRAG